MLGQLRVTAFEQDQHLHPGDVAVAGHLADSSGLARLLRLGVARGKGADAVPRDVGGGRRRINGQSADRLGRR